jgi:hypothetical protein
MAYCRPLLTSFCFQWWRQLPHDPQVSQVFGPLLAAEVDAAVGRQTLVRGRGLPLPQE